MPDPEYTVDHELSDADENVHHVWDNGLEPVLTVEPGEIVRFECRDALDKRIEERAEGLREARHLLTIPGLSHYSALVIYSELGDIDRFDAPKRW